MKCDRCGCWTHVAETRQHDDGYTLRRTRKCANGHRFHTYECLPSIYTRHRKSVIAQVLKAAKERAAVWTRNRLIVAQLKVMPAAKVSALHNLAKHHIHRIRREFK